MKFTRKEKVRFQHIDFAGIVFYPRFLEMLNALVEDWFGEALERPFSKMHETNGIPTVDLKVQFKQPARLDEILEKHLWVKELGKASMVCAFEFTNEKGKTCLEGEVTLVNVSISKDREGIKSEAFTDEMRSKLERFIN
jgi:4-hydroxybenzoyl-CoA thioesterase